MGQFQEKRVSGAESNVVNGSDDGVGEDLRAE